MRNFNQTLRAAVADNAWRMPRMLSGIRRLCKNIPKCVLHKTKCGYLKCNLPDLISPHHSILTARYNHGYIISHKIIEFAYIFGSYRLCDFFNRLNEYNHVNQVNDALIRAAPVADLIFERLNNLLEDSFQNSPSLRSLGAVLKMRYLHGMPEILISYKNIVVTVEGIDDSSNDIDGYQFPYGDVTFKWSFGDINRIKELFLNTKAVDLEADNFGFISRMMKHSSFMLNKGHMYVAGYSERFKVYWRKGLCFDEHLGDIVLAASNLDFFTLAYKVRRWLEFINEEASPYSSPTHFFMGAPESYGLLAKLTASPDACDEHYRPEKQDCDKIECQLRPQCYIYKGEDTLTEEPPSSLSQPAQGQQTLEYQADTTEVAFIYDNRLDPMPEASGASVAPY